MVGVYLLLVFVSGAVVGAFGHRLYAVKSVTATSAPSPSFSRNKYLKEMETRLKLDPQQVTQLAVILDEFRSRYRSERDKIEPAMQRIQQEQRKKIRTILKENQQAEYQKMIEERDQKH